jgi:CRP/FNR family transcriptional regulator, cyclic AMP receptor protein
MPGTAAAGAPQRRSCAVERSVRRWRPGPGSAIPRRVGTPLDHCAGLAERVFEKGEIVLEEGVRGPLFVLAEGAVEILKGDFRINIVDEPGSILGEVSALLATAPMATVRALERSRLFVAEDGLAFLSSKPELALEVARLLARRLNSVTSYLADLKKQFADHESHLGIVDEVLETLVHGQEQGEPTTGGSDREPDPNDES